jgi:hypothetical protein
VADAEPTAGAGARAGAGAGAKMRVASELLCSSLRAFSAPLCVRRAGLAAGGALYCARCSYSPS